MTLRDRTVLSGQPLEGPSPPDDPDGSPGPAPHRPAGQVWFGGGLIAVSVFFFFFDGLFRRPEALLGGYALQLGALYGPALLRGEWYRLVLTAVEHGSALHLALNMSAVVTLGFPLERAVRSWRMAVITWVATMGSSTFAVFFAFDAPTIGASGAILGWAGALLPISTPQTRRSLYFLLAQVVVISLIPGVSWQGHLGGFLFGLPCGYALRLGREKFQALAPLMMAVAAAIAVGATYAAAARYG